MSDIRPLWFESHLLNTPSGRAARRRCETLGNARHEYILGRGDELARVSIAAAQEFYRAAAAAHDVFGERLDEWAALGAGLAAGEHGLREGAVAYFRIAPERARRLGLDGLRRWAELAAEVARVSKKLAAIFCETTAPLLGDVGLETLSAWARQGTRLHGQHGWHGEFLAQAYFSAAPQALRLLTPEQFTLWAGLGAAVRRSLKEAEFYRTLPEPVGEWSDAERNAYLRACLALAIQAPQVAVQYYRTVPAAVSSLPPELRAPLLQACALSAKRAGNAFGDLLPVLGAVVLDVPSAARADAMTLALRVAERFPAGLPAMLRSLPRAFEEADLEVVRAWVERGLGFAERTEVGLAYFALESRTSLKILRATSTGVLVEEIQGVLRKYIHMLSGEPAVIHSVTLFQLRPPLEEFPAENEVALPLRVDLLETHEDNERLYRVLAAQVAGRREFGTYGWRWGDGSERPPGSDLVAYLHQEDRPELVGELFLVAEGYRVACRLVREYPGLAAELRWACEQLLGRWMRMAVPPEEVIFDAVLAAAMLGEMDEAPPWLRAAGDVILPAIAPLASPSTTVEDALRLAETLAAVLLEKGAARRIRQDQWDFGGLLLEKVSGDALIDPYYDESDQTPFDSDEEAPAVPASRAPDEQLELPEGAKLPMEQDDEPGGSRPLSLEELKRLLESGADLKISQAHGDEVDGIGLYITDLVGKMPSEQLEELKRLLGEGERGGRRAPRRWLESRHDEPMFLYDEWDYHLGDYRPRWCKLREIGLDGDSGLFFNRTLDEYAALIPEIRRQFQRIRPEMYRMVRGLEDGEDFDLNAAVNARIEARARRSPSHKLYVARKREERDVATLFLLDMSASTDEPMVRPTTPASAEDAEDVLLGRAPLGPRPRPRRIIDVTKEALVIMAQALEEIGDTYAIYGFSGHGRDNVEFYLVKSFTESLTSAVRGRIGGIEPKRSTRMGTALRHAVDKMSAVTSASKHLILLSDGFPQDFDYGQDRRSNVYGIRDTTAALRECEAAGITPFCITVDKAGHDYLREMCESSRYMVIEDMAALPKELPKIYQRVVWSAA